MQQRIAVLIDGGHLRVYARRAKKAFDPDYIEKIAHACALADEVIHRILYYDCPPYEGEAVLPVSGAKKQFAGSDKWLHQLSHKDLFAVRTGILKFRGFVLKQSRIPFTPTAPLKDDDFRGSVRTERRGHANRSRYGHALGKSFGGTYRAGDERHGLYSSNETRSPRGSSGRSDCGPRILTSSGASCAFGLPKKYRLANLISAHVEVVVESARHNQPAGPFRTTF